MKVPWSPQVRASCTNTLGTLVHPSKWSCSVICCGLGGLTLDRFKEIIKVVKETSQSTKEAMQTLCKI